MRNIVDASKLDLKSTIVNIRRVSKTVKGGKNMRFSVTVVVGDGNGYVGVGLGKSVEIPEAVRKAEEDAKKNLIYVQTVGTTVLHRNLGVFGAGRVLIMPAAQGTGEVPWFTRQNHRRGKRLLRPHHRRSWTADRTGYFQAM